MKLTNSNAFRWNSLGVKLFGSYLLIIAIGTLVILNTVDLVAPNAFTSHMQMMQTGGMGGMMGNTGSSAVNSSLDQAFKSALSEGMLVAGLIGVIVAIVISFFVTRLIVTPVSRLAQASKRIASGHYAERVPQRTRDELGEMAGSFNEMAAALESTERRRLELIGDVAHELRTPVATLEGYMEGLLDGVVQPSEEIWISLHEEAGRLRRLIDDLQELSRAEARQIPLHLTVVNPLEIARAVVERLENQFREKGLEFSATLPSSLPAVQADRDRAVQVLTNLLTNALRYTPVPGTVTLELVAIEGAVQFKVTDSGMGISSEQLPHLFERFYRVDKSRSRMLGGSGVGLTIAKALVEAMDGQIEAASGGPGQGSTFIFILPQAGL
ncbi:MAG TPA: ATP-binding protein [Chloroflexia bacterium]|nr:ATP-binding protein [Chloroflexia bacterium]